MDNWIEGLLSRAQNAPSKRTSGDPINRLLQEHRVISDAACTLESWALWFEQGYRIHQECLTALMRFMIEFVDEVHHEKEETILVPTLSEYGLLLSAKATSKLEAEHHQERYLVGELRQLVDDMDGQRSRSNTHFTSLARELVSFQKRHLETETREIYALVDCLKPMQKNTLRRRLRAFDRDTPSALEAWHSIFRWLLDPQTVIESSRHSEVPPHLQELLH